MLIISRWQLPNKINFSSNSKCWHISFSDFLNLNFCVMNHQSAQGLIWLANDSSPLARAHFLFRASANQARSLRSRALRECSRVCAMLFGRQRRVFITVSFLVSPVTFCGEMSTPQNSSSNSSSPNTVYTKFEVPSLIEHLKIVKRRNFKLSANCIRSAWVGLPN